MKIIITGANGDIAISILKILKKKFKKSIIHGSDININQKGKYYFGKLIKVHLANSSKYLRQIQIFTKKYDLIIPTSEKEIEFISKNIDKLNYKKILINEKNIINNFLDKYKAFNFLSVNKINQIGYCKILKKITEIKSFPTIIKTRFGAGNKNYIIANTKNDLKNMQLVKNKQYIFQKYLNNEREFTACIYKNTDFSKIIILDRILDKDKTFYGKIYNNKSIEKKLLNFAKIIKLKGSINVQFKLIGGKLFIFDVNPRLSSTVLMRHQMGFEDCYWWITDFMKLKNQMKLYKKPKKNIVIRDEIIKLYD